LWSGTNPPRINPVLTTFALNEAELNTSTCTELAYPKAKLLIETPVNTIKNPKRVGHYWRFFLAKAC
jgi:hypothetical protein